MIRHTHRFLEILAAAIIGSGPVNRNRISGGGEAQHVEGSRNGALRILVQVVGRVGSTAEISTPGIATCLGIGPVTNVIKSVLKLLSGQRQLEIPGDF